jgi:hypothetical protein
LLLEREVGVHITCPPLQSKTLSILDRERERGQREQIIKRELNM